MIDPSARIHPSADLEDAVAIGPRTAVWHRAQIRGGASIGADAIIGRDAFIDEGVVLGDRVKVQNGALVYHGVTVGDGVFIGPGAILTNDRTPRALTATGDLARADDWTVTPIHLADGASIGAGAIVVAGCDVGRHANGPRPRAGGRESRPPDRLGVRLRRAASGARRRRARVSLVWPDLRVRP